MIKKECQDNTYGDKCQYCKAGYYGDALAGSSNDCKPSIDLEYNKKNSYLSYLIIFLIK